jgi:hypothetical protein
MARGWESKSVESQIEAAESKRAARQHAPLTEEEIRVQRERESLEMSRTRVLRDLAVARHPQYREQLTAALKYLEEKLASLTSGYQH